MSFRTEEKLYIKPENLIQFQEFLVKKSVKKIHHPRTIESLYFDNYNLDMHTDSEEGIVPRKKIRIRTYPNDNDSKIYLEIKNSSVEGRFKTRKIINNQNFIDYKSLGIFDNQYGICSPKLYVKYVREYFILNDVRISIDKSIQYKDYRTSLTFNDNKIGKKQKVSKIWKTLAYHLEYVDQNDKVVESVGKWENLHDANRSQRLSQVHDYGSRWGLQGGAEIRLRRGGRGRKLHRQCGRPLHRCLGKGRVIRIHSQDEAHHVGRRHGTRLENAHQERVIG